MLIEFNTSPRCSINWVGWVIHFSLDTLKPRSPKGVKVSFIFALK